MTRNKTLIPGIFGAFVVLTVLLLKFGAFPGTGGGISVRHAPGVTGVISVQPPGPAQQTVSVLFIGNSYTFYNNMPGMMAAIAGSDPGNRTALEIQAVTQGGAKLAGLLQTGEGVQAIRQRKWNYVVLQDQSFWAFSKGSVIETTGAALNWTREIVNAQARPLVFMNWPRQPGSDWYNNPQYPFLNNAEHSFYKIRDETLALAKKLHGSAVPVGEYWYYALGNHPELQLYEADGSHPSREGSYLAALVFYRFLTGRLPRESSYTPPGVPEDHARTIREITSYGG